MLAGAGVGEMKSGDEALVSGSTEARGADCLTLVYGLAGAREEDCRATRLVGVSGWRVSSAGRFGERVVFPNTMPWWNIALVMLTTMPAARLLIVISPVDGTKAPEMVHPVAAEGTMKGFSKSAFIRLIVWGWRC